MGDTVRFGISMEGELLEKFDRMIERQSYTNRSEAIRDLIREKIVKKEWEGGGVVAGAILLIYDHHITGLSQKITENQHHYHEMVISTQHIHMDPNNCMEIIIVKGKRDRIRELYNSLKATRGVQQCDIIKTIVKEKE